MARSQRHRPGNPYRVGKGALSIATMARYFLYLALAFSFALNGRCESAQDRGATAFHEKGCAQCHAIGGIGGHKGPDLSGVGRRKNKNALRTQILNGGGAMPAFREALADDEVEALVSYLQHCRTKPSPEVSRQASAQ